MSITKICKIDDCFGVGFLRTDGRRYPVKGYCKKHYMRTKRGTDMHSSQKERRKAIINGGVAKIPIGLDAKHGYALIDSEDSWVDEYNWTLSNGYLVSYVNGRLTRLHRLIMSAKDDQIIDHINRVKTDNRKSNLRLATQGQNNTNVSAYSTSGFKGVYRNSENSWSARINTKEKNIYIGSYRTPELAAAAYDAMAVKLFGEYAGLNNAKEKHESLTV